LVDAASLKKFRFEHFDFLLLSEFKDNLGAVMSPQLRLIQDIEE